MKTKFVKMFVFSLNTFNLKQLTQVQIDKYEIFCYILPKWVSQKNKTTVKCSIEQQQNFDLECRVEDEAATVNKIH